MKIGGPVTNEGIILVGEDSKGKIEGNLNCKFLEIYGEFTGNGEVRELKVCKGGKVKGSLSYNTIVVEVGATISGPMKPIEKDPVLLIENK